MAASLKEILPSQIFFMNVSDNSSMKYFSATSLDELKKQYRALALRHHPDVGGDADTMKAINSEYDALFPALKISCNIRTSETAASTRSEFYTQNGWKGAKHDWSRSTTETAALIRTALKEIHGDCKWSVTTHLASMCAEISVSLMEAPHAVIAPGRKETYLQINGYYIDRDERLTQYGKDLLSHAQQLLNEYNYKDCDSMIDYFHVDFYDSLNVGKWDRPFQIVERRAKAPKLRSGSQRPHTAHRDSNATSMSHDPYKWLNAYMAKKTAQ